MPAGRNKKQTPRHDGGKSRVCVYCSLVGSRVIVAGGFAHRRCIPKMRGPQKNRRK